MLGCQAGACLTVLGGGGTVSGGGGVGKLSPALAVGIHTASTKHISGKAATGLLAISGQLLDEVPRAFLKTPMAAALNVCGRAQLGDLQMGPGA